MNLTEYDISNPFSATITKSERITDENTEEVRHINLRVNNPSFHFVEGQSVGVLAPGAAVFGQKHHLRLYSIASSREGEGTAGDEISLCVRRCFYVDEMNGERYPGVASNYLCDAQPGDSIPMVGPYGRHFLPPRDPTCNLLLIGAGTGIAPFRAFLKHIYRDQQKWEGKIRLFYGAKTGFDLLYRNERNNDLANYYDEETFQAFEALSPRPHVDAPVDMEGALRENITEACRLINDPKTHVYLSGLSRLEEVVDSAFEHAFGSGEAWDQQKAKLMDEGRWATLFYD